MPQPPPELLGAHDEDVPPKAGAENTLAVSPPHRGQHSASRASAIGFLMLNSCAQFLHL